MHSDRRHSDIFVLSAVTGPDCRRPWSAIIAACVFLSSGGLSSARAESKPVDAKTLNDRHQQVVKMSRVEREHLQRNLATFQQLTPDQQNHYRQLNEQLDDDKKHGGQLSNVMQTYTAWLQTLTPGQREQLRKETDGGRKLALVQQFKEEQYRQIEAVTISLPEFEPPRPRNFGPRPLTANELNTVMKLVIAELPEDEREKLSQMPRFDQYRNALERSIHHAEEPKNWPSAKVQESILNTFPPDRRQFIKNSKNQRAMVVGTLFLSVVNQANEEVKWPKEEEFHQIEEELDREQKAKLEKLRPEERRHQLTTRFFDKHPDKAFKHLQEIQNGLRRLMAKVDVHPPRPPFPGDEPPPPPPRPPNERGGPDGRPGDRPPGRGGPDDRPRGRDGSKGKLND